MPQLEYVYQQPQARVLLLSQRCRFPVMSHCRLYEFEDLVARVDAVDVVGAARRPLEYWRARNLCTRLEGRSLGGLLAPGAWQPDRSYEAVVLSCQSLSELSGLVPLSGLRRAGRIFACYIEEIWREEVATRTTEVALLRQFDHVFIGCKETADMLRGTLGERCTYLPAAVDTWNLNPGAERAERVIDIFWMGRRTPALHGRLAELAARKGLFYLYDTRLGSTVTGIQEHRRALASLIRRSRFFVVAPGTRKGAENNGSAVQEDIGARYFEGAAGGAVMIGRAARTGAFQELLGWTDAVVPVREDGSDIEDVWRTLGEDPERTEAISRRNVVESLRRHDGVYRWKAMLGVLGLPIDERVLRREEECHRLADEMERRAPALKSVAVPR